MHGWSPQSVWSSSFTLHTSSHFSIPSRKTNLVFFIRVNAGEEWRKGATLTWNCNLSESESEFNIWITFFLGKELSGGEGDEGRGWVTYRKRQVKWNTKLEYKVCQRITLEWSQKERKLFGVLLDAHPVACQKKTEEASRAGLRYRDRAINWDQLWIHHKTTISLYNSYRIKFSQNIKEVSALSRPCRPTYSAPPPPSHHHQNRQRIPLIHKRTTGSVLNHGPWLAIWLCCCCLVDLQLNYDISLSLMELEGDEQRRRDPFDWLQ